MPVNDPIADLLTRLRNAQHGRRTDCLVPWSKIKQGICELLQAQGYVGEVDIEGEASEKMIRITFLTDRPALQLKRISTPGGRKYVSAIDIRKYLHGASLAILSTSSGLLTSKDAYEKKVGGEILCTIA